MLANPPPTPRMRTALAHCRRHFMFAAGFSALLNLLYIAPTLYMLQVYDRVVPTQGHITLLFLSIVLLFSLATLSLLDRARSRLLIRAGVQLDVELAPALLDTTLGRSELSGAGQSLRDFDALRQAFAGQGVLALFDAPWLPVYVAVCFLVHPMLGLVAVAGGMVLALLAWKNERATRSARERANGAANACYASQDMILGNAEAIRALGMRQALVRRQSRQRETMLREQTTASLKSGDYMAMTKFVRLMLQSGALGVGALLAIDNLISGGAIFAASFLIARALAPIEQLIGNWKSLAQARSSYRRLELVLGQASDIPTPTRLPRPRGALKLEGVTVLNDAHDGAIISNVSLQIAAGEVIAIVGPSGAGKSTLARVIAGALRADRGSIRIDNADMADWDQERLARHIGYLPQEPSLFAGTVKENIARFATELDAGPEAADAAAIDVAAIASADRARVREMVQHLPGGFDYMIRPGGRGLSAGQTQRIALARAVFGNPTLLVLDEPNAHLDQEGDAALMTTIEHYKKSRHTILIVSHKMGILPIVDKILLLREGRVEMFGPRDEIIRRLSPPARGLAAVGVSAAQGG